MENLNYIHCVNSEDVLTLPRGYLVIRFAHSSDFPNILDIFENKKHNGFDPQDKLRKRTKLEIFSCVANSKAVIAEDNLGNIRAFALATHHRCHLDSTKSFIEVGGIMCNLQGGYKLSQHVINLLTHNIARTDKTLSSIYAQVSSQNHASNNIFSEKLKWNIVRDELKTRDLSLIQQSNSSSTTKEDKTWYEFGYAAMRQSRSSLKQLSKNKFLLSTHSPPINVEILDHSAYCS